MEILIAPAINPQTSAVIARIKSIFLLSRHLGPREVILNCLRMVFIWSPLSSVLFNLIFNGLVDDFATYFLISTTISIVVSLFCYLGTASIAYGFTRYSKRLGLKNQLAPNTLAISRTLRVATSLTLVLPGLYLGFQLGMVVSQALGHNWNTPRFTDYSSGLFFGLLLSSLFSLIEVVREAKSARREAELQRRANENEKLKAQISALTAQMNPHLLFNSLNTIASTIQSDPASAEEMVIQLSELYRATLKAAKGDQHSLADELQLCQAYLEIEKRRFGSRITFEIDVDGAISQDRAQLPVLLLQPLVENAVKHGLLPKREGGRISIRAKTLNRELHLSVADNGVGLDGLRNTTGSGSALKNCEERIKLKYGALSEFRFYRSENAETTALIKIPLAELGL